MVDPKDAVLFIPPGLRDFKLRLFERIGEKIGTVVRGEFHELEKLPSELVPIVGCTPQLRPIIDKWMMTGRKWIYWDRGYCRRVFATHLPRGENGGYYRWHFRSFQMKIIRKLPSDRWDLMNTEVLPWQKNPYGHIVIAAPTETYGKFHMLDGWLDRIVRKLSLITDRQLVVRDKETKRALQKDLAGAYCLVAHGSNAAVEAVICGCPVIVDRSSAASLVGSVDLKAAAGGIPYPDRSLWLNSLAYSQFNEQELVDGTLWKLLT